MKQVVYTAGALKSLKVHGNMRTRIMTAVAEYAADQNAHAKRVKPLVGTSAKRMRVGEFRVIFEESAAQVLVVKIGHAAVFTSKGACHERDDYNDPRSL